MSYREVYFALREIATSARRDRLPGPLARSLIDTAYKLLDLCQHDERCAARFAAMVLSGPTNLRHSTGQLPEKTAKACWRLISLLEYLASFDGRQ